MRKGTQLFMIQWVTHRDARFFPEPERFRPDRWAPDADPPHRKDAFYPFGGGPRNCIGAGFAMIEAPLVLAALLQRRRFEPVPDREVGLQPAVTLRPRGGLRMVVRRR